MARTNMASSITTLLVVALLLLAAMLFFMPLRTYAAEDNARLGLPAQAGGGNALARATAGGSLGLSRAFPASGLLSHLTFASTRGGQPETTPADENSNTGGATSSEQSDGENGADATSAGGAGGNGGGNGGATAGNGGNGGDGGGAAPGGLV
ncbi:MAG: hypothetical protein Q7S89_02395, partial [bacterium]|nr:hypothetical protein [bacterium]